MTVESGHVKRRIRERRGELNMLTQQDLATAAGVSKTTIVRLESGQRVGTAYQTRVEEALRWSHGSIDALLAGGEPSEMAAKCNAHHPPEQSAEPDPADYQSDLDYLQAVYWYMRKLGRSHAAVMRGFRMASAIYLREHGEDGEDGSRIVEGES